jgi:hypothetical protein
MAASSGVSQLKLKLSGMGRGCCCVTNGLPRGLREVDEITIAAIKEGCQTRAKVREAHG